MPARRYLHRFVRSVLAHYRTMDPVVAQFWAAPGVQPIVLPIVPSESGASA